MIDLLTFETLAKLAYFQVFINTAQIVSSLAKLAYFLEYESAISFCF